MQNPQRNKQERIKMREKSMIWGVGGGGREGEKQYTHITKSKDDFFQKTPESGHCAKINKKQEDVQVNRTQNKKEKIIYRHSRYF